MAESIAKVEENENTRLFFLFSLADFINKKKQAK
jgi:hypothetical protein